MFCSVSLFCENTLGTGCSRSKLGERGLLPEGIVLSSALHPSLGPSWGLPSVTPEPPCEPAYKPPWAHPRGWWWWWAEALPHCLLPGLLRNKVISLARSHNKIFDNSKANDLFYSLQAFRSYLTYGLCNISINVFIYSYLNTTVSAMDNFCATEDYW